MEAGLQIQMKSKSFLELENKQAGRESACAGRNGGNGNQRVPRQKPRERSSVPSESSEPPAITAASLAVPAAVKFPLKLFDLTFKGKRVRDRRACRRPPGLMRARSAETQPERRCQR